jgi:uncharacterized membrane protein YuzA (DUF378 family)
MTNLNSLDWLATALVIIGALNWGLIGLGALLGTPNPLLTWNLVNVLFAGVADGLLEAITYLLVGLAGLYEIYVGYKFAQSGDNTTM